MNNCEQKDAYWFVSAGSWGDGKSVCLWRQEGVYGSKIARFQSAVAARFFINEFNIPISERVEKLIEEMVTKEAHR